MKAIVSTMAEEYELHRAGGFRFRNEVLPILPRPIFYVAVVMARFRIRVGADAGFCGIDLWKFFAQSVVFGLPVELGRYLA